MPLFCPAVSFHALPFRIGWNLLPTRLELDGFEHRNRDRKVKDSTGTERRFHPQRQRPGITHREENITHQRLEIRRGDRRDVQRPAVSRRARRPRGRA